MTELLPCPFCGGEATFSIWEAYSTDASYSCIKCQKCLVTMPCDSPRFDFTTRTWSDQTIEAIAAWNRRAPAPLTSTISQNRRDTMNLYLRTTDKDGKAHGGFQWPMEVGAIVTAPDWKPTAECGNGLHGLLDGLGGASHLSFNADAVWWIVEADDAMGYTIARKEAPASVEDAA